MALIKDLQKIYKNNTFHARIIITILYLEISNRYTAVFFKILRKLIVQAIYHCDIYPHSVNKDVLTTLILPHPYNIIIHSSAKIGIRNTILHDVTIGVKKVGDESDKAAQIGDDVLIGAKSMIVGHVNIADGAKIGAGARVFNDVKANQVEKCVETRFYVGAHALVVRDGKYLITRRALDDDLFPGYWDLPGGTVEVGESLEECLHREIKEELGLEVVKSKLVHGFMRKGALPRIQPHSFILKCKLKEGEINLDEEHSEYKWLTIEELKNIDEDVLIPYLKDYLENFKE